jgi:hypothetical protein
MSGASLAAAKTKGGGCQVNGLAIIAFFFLAGFRASRALIQAMYSLQ